MTWRPSLKYPNNRVEAIEQTDFPATPGTPPAIFAGETPWTGTKTLTLTLTQDEFTQLFSALMTGADISYGEDSHKIVWLFWQAIEYP